MKHVKLYNIIFPLWFLLFIPPNIFITLFGNFLIDSLVLVACFYIFRLSQQQFALMTFYKRSIIKVWLLGFLADIIGAGILFFISIFLDAEWIPNELMTAVNYDPFTYPAALAIVICAMLVTGSLIFVFNYNFTFTKLIENKKLRFKTALTLAIVTMPWTFLLPAKWFYSGF